MASINEIISTKATEGIVTTDKAITKLDQSTIKFIKVVEQLSTSLKKGGISLKEVNAAQKQSTTSKTKLTQLEKEQLAAEKALERQRKSGLKVIEKQYIKEQQLQSAIKKEVKSEQDLITKTNALVAVRRRLDQSTTKGVAEHKRLTSEIDKNTTALKKSDKQIGRNQRDVGNYGKALDKLKGSFAVVAIGVAAAIAVFSKLSGFITASIEKFDKQMLAEVSLSTALGKTSKALLKQASAFQQLTRFGDEEIIQGQAFLAQMGLTEKQILKITPAILDFAQAKGIELKTASDLVAKSIGSETNALSRYGIQIEGAVGGNERLDSALTALNSKFGGQAEAALSGAGALKQLSNTWGDLQEIVGGFIARGINPAIRGLNKLLTIRKKESQSIIEEQGQLNVLIGAITNTNASQEARNKLIGDLQTKYPDFLGNLDSEKVSNIELETQLQKVNNKYSDRIKLLIAQEIQAGAATELAESYKEEVRILERISFYENEIAEGRSFSEGDVNTQLDYNDALTTANNQLTKVKENRDGINKSVQDAIALVTQLGGVGGEGGSLIIPDKEKNDAAFEEIIEEEQEIIGDGYDQQYLRNKEKNEKIAAADQKLMDDLQKIRDEEFEDIIEAEEKIRIAKEKNDADELARAEQLKQAKIDLAVGAAEAAFSIYQSNLDREAMAIEEQRAYQLQLAGDDKEAQAKINEKFDKQAAAIRTKQAKADKAAAMITVAINAALAIVSAYSTPPAPVGFALGAIMAGLAAVQIAAIAAQPIPKFFKGTDNAPAGLISVAEGNKRELIETKTGKLLMANKETITSGLQGSKIYTNEQTERIMNHSGYDSPDMKGVIESNNRVEQAIKNIPRVKIDRDNREITERKGDYFKTYLNAKINRF